MLIVLMLENLVNNIDKIFFLMTTVDSVVGTL